MSSTILRLTRGETVEVYRVRMLSDGAVCLERFQDGAFAEPRVFRNWQSSGADEAPSAGAGSAQQMDRAIRYISTYLNGAVTVGERDLLSPASAMARNVRWFPGDIQMLATAFPYVRELFPSAQFHVSQLFRRLFGDVAFLALIISSCAFWLRTNAPVGMSGLAIALLVISMLAIIGFDRYAAPFALGWRRMRAVVWKGRWLEAAWRAPVLLVQTLVRGTVTVLLETVIGLSNLVIHPLRILESWRQLRRGKTLEWKASSVSAGQDMRGWPLAEFVDVYGPPLRAGVLLLAFLAWLIALGAPIGILGLSGLGIFVCSFLTAALYAWYSALPHTSDGVPQYALPARELGALVAIGAGGLGVSALLWRLGLYPVPAFEGSIAIVAMFLSTSALFAVLYPLYYRARFARSRSRRPSNFRLAHVALIAALAACSSAEALGGGLFSRFFHLNEGDFRMPEPERRVYEAVQRSLRQHGRVDPEPLLRAEGAQSSLKALPNVRVPDVPEPKGVPEPRLPDLALASAADTLPELYPLPLERRLPMLNPARELAAPPPEPQRAIEAGRDATSAAERRALALTPRVLSPEEQRLQREFIERADFPWISREELARLGRASPEGKALPLVEVARAERWDDVRRLWDGIEAARRGGVPDRVRLERLRDGIDGVVSLGREPTAEAVQLFLERELALIEAWSRDYPNLPFAAQNESGAGARTRYVEITAFLLRHDMSADQLARHWRLDYVNAHWPEPPVLPALSAAFRDRGRTEPWELLELDWEGNSAAARRWEELQTQQAVGMKLWRGAAVRRDEPGSGELFQIAQFLDQVLAQLASAQRSGPYAVLADLLRLEGVDPRAIESGEAAAALLASRVWTRAVSGRLATVVARSAVGAEPLESAADRALLREVSVARYPDDGGDPLLRRVFDWLVLIDHSETYEELASGYARFLRDAKELGLNVPGPALGASLSEAQLHRDLLDLWRVLGERFPGLPARDDMVAEFLCQTAYFSTPDGQTRRTPRELVADFAGLLSAVQARMEIAPPAPLQRLADLHIEKTRGRVSKSARARRFFAWWMVAARAEVLDHNYRRHGIERRAKLDALARDWAQLIEAGSARFPHLPWLQAGFSEHFVNAMAVQGWRQPRLFQRFGRQLAIADDLMARHTVASKTFESVVDRRTQAQTGTLYLDPTLRRANALVALAELCQVLRRNGSAACDRSPALVTERFSVLYEKLARDYPELYWQGDGIVEYYLVLELRQRWTLHQLVERFDPEWSLANALASHGWLERLNDVQALPPDTLDAAGTSLASFVTVQAERLEEKTGVRVTKPRARAMNALGALSRLVLSAAREGLLPEQHGQPWNEGRVVAWAAALTPEQLDAETLGWVQSLTVDYSNLLQVMREAGPRFPWQSGSFVESTLLGMYGAGASVTAMREGFEPRWRAASDLIERGLVLPESYVELVSRDGAEELRSRIARARGLEPHVVPDSEVEADPALVPLNATLALADVVANVRQKHGEDPDPLALAQRIADVRRIGPQRYPHVPWAVKGLVPSLVVAAYGPDFADDFWKYAELVNIPTVDRLLGELGRLRARARDGEPSTPPSGESGMPVEVLEDVQSALLRETGRRITSEPLLAFNALRDAVFVLRELLSDQPVSIDNAVTLVRLRARLRALDRDYPDLGIVQGTDSSLRVGFAERLAAVAMKEELAAGLDPKDPSFVEQAISRIKQRYLTNMQEIYSAVRASFPPEEIAYHQERIRQEAAEDAPEQAARHGLSSDDLSVPEVKADDIVADAALYEILYANEIGQGQPYLRSLFEAFDAIQRRPATQHAFRAGLDAIDRRYTGELARPEDPGYALWRSSPSYRRWWKERGDFIQRSRGRIIGLARTFALVHRAAFAPDADPAARAAFARFGSFEAYRGRVLDGFDAARGVPEIDRALASLEREDPFLADGVQFALALFQCHVLDSLYPRPGDPGRVLASIGAALPDVAEDQRRILGFAPRLESGVPLYDARMLFLRGELEPGLGTRVLYRLGLMQRGVQRWARAHVLAQAYKVLFFRDLDMEDPTPAVSDGAMSLLRRLPPELAARLTALWPNRVGDDVQRFLELELPARLEAETGSKDLEVWLSWLMEHGEIGLDGAPTGENPYALEVAEFERRLAHYRGVVEAGKNAGRSVRAEEQRARDVEKEYASFRRQVQWLSGTARQASLLGAQARDDYARAVGWHALFPLALILLCRRGARALAERLGPRRAALRRIVAALGLWLPLTAAVGLPCWVAAAPDRAAAVGERWLEPLGLLGRDVAGRIQLRGAAAQLAKLGATAPPPRLR